VVLPLDLDPDLLHHPAHLGADVLQRVDGRDREVPFLVARLVPEVRAGAADLAVEGVLDRVARLPLTLARLDLVVRVVHAVVVGDPVEDEELDLRTEVGDVADARLL